MKYSSYLSRRLKTFCLAAVMLLAPAMSAGQMQTQPPSPNVGPQPEGNVWEEQQRKEMAKKANLQRQQEIKKDTEKLLELATELKQYVDKSSENTLSLEVVKKAEQIEKLAKAVKDKMKGP